MTRRVGWYIHHHGAGHLSRLRTIAPHLDAQIRCFSSLPEPDTLPPNCSWTVLDRDDERHDGSDPHEADPTAGGLLHWAPLGHPGHRDRLGAIAAALTADPVQAFVVDVSVEVALLVRLLGVPVVLIAQPGRRDDDTHRLGFRAATTILAPWPHDLLQPPHLAAMAEKTVYTGGISRFEARMHDGGSGARARGEDVAILGGRGGTALTDLDIAEAAGASGRVWHNLGATPGAAWAADPWEPLVTAGVVVAWAGQNSIADLAAAAAPAVVIPQERPFAEQRETALALERAGLAVVAAEWPHASAWPDLIRRAADLQPDWERWQVSGGAARAASVILDTADGRR